MQTNDRREQSPRNCVAWQTFKIGPYKYLALDNGRSWQIWDNYLGNYGTWHTLNEFKKRVKKGENLCLN